MKLNFGTTQVSGETLNKVRAEMSQTAERRLAEKMIAAENICQEYIDKQIRELRHLRKLERKIQKQLEKLKSATNPVEFAKMLKKDSIFLTIPVSAEDYQSET